MLNELTVKSLKEIVDIDVDNAVVLETASTGFASNDEFLSITILDLKGNIILNSLIKPIDLETWIYNPSYYGITPKDVSNSPDIYEFKELLENTLSNASRVIGFNIDPKVELLLEYIVLKNTITITDVRIAFMKAYTTYYSDDSDLNPTSIKRCARYFGYNSNFSTTLENARAIAYCFNAIRADYLKALPEAQAEEDKELAANLASEKMERRILLGVKVLLIIIIGAVQISLSLAVPALKIPSLAFCCFLYFLIFTYFKIEK